MSTQAAASDAHPQGAAPPPAAAGSSPLPASPAAPEWAGGGSLLDSLAVATRRPDSPAASRLEQFLAEPAPRQALGIWLGGSWDGDSQQLVRRLNRDVALIDRLLNDQLNVILHHPDFQRLEAAWRGVRYLTERADEEGESNVKIKLLSASWRELEKDFERAIEFDQSVLFRKVYEEEFGNPGGEPYGVLLGDYEIHPRPGNRHPHDDMAVLAGVAQGAAAAFCPFVAGASPAMFGLDDFGGLQYRLNHEQTLQGLDYLKWNALRRSEDARFLGLAVPRVLMRLPYADDGSRLDRFCFREEVAGPDRRKYLWGNAAYAFGALLIRSFAESGWLADIRGVQRDIDGGGLVTGLPVHSFGTDRHGVAIKSSTDVIITDELERQLSDLGFLVLCDAPDSEFSAFYSNPSIQQPKQYDRPVATANARLSSMLQYMLCVSRFAHYLKVLGRDKVGGLGEAAELEQELQNWIVRYVTTDAEASAEVKARFPLREAKVEIQEMRGKPGAYQCVIHLAPHYQLDELTASVRVATELAAPRGR